MDWDVAIERNGQALKRILLALVAMAGLADCKRTHLPRRLYRAVLRLLRPAEAAARRLVIVAARGLTVTLPPLRPRKAKLHPTIVRNGTGTGIVLPPGCRQSRPRKPARLPLPLLDPLPRHGRISRRRSAVSSQPRLSVPGFGAPSPVGMRRPPEPHDLIETARLRLRLEALASALDDLPAEALRFARWRARRDLRRNPRGSVRRLSPLRPGRPPGGVRRPAQEVHEVLADLNFFALRALEGSNTS